MGWILCPALRLIRTVSNNLGRRGIDATIDALQIRRER
jgi:hypothetical protein